MRPVPRTCEGAPSVTGLPADCSHGLVPLFQVAVGPVAIRNAHFVGPTVPALRLVPGHARAFEGKLVELLTGGGRVVAGDAGPAEPLLLNPDRPADRLERQVHQTVRPQFLGHPCLLLLRRPPAPPAPGGEQLPNGAHVDPVEA